MNPATSAPLPLEDPEAHRTGGSGPHSNPQLRPDRQGAVASARALHHRHPHPVRGRGVAVCRRGVRRRQSETQQARLRHSARRSRRSHPARGARDSASIAWMEANAAPYNPSPLAYDGRFYVLWDFGFLSCRDARTGRELYGKQRLKVDGTAGFTASPGPTADESSASARMATPMWSAAVTPAGWSGSMRWANCAWPLPPSPGTGSSSAPPRASTACAKLIDRILKIPLGPRCLAVSLPQCDAAGILGC